jgi:hypothetical protein
MDFRVIANSLFVVNLANFARVCAAASAFAAAAQGARFGAKGLVLGGI